ncbi:MAG: DUF779 domain-containing protein [Deferribacterales bacterium]
MKTPTGEPAVIATKEALEAIERLKEEHGHIMFFQSGGCCDGSLPMCFGKDEFIVGDNDVMLGELGGSPFYIDFRQYEVWKHTQLILDVGEGAPEGFSLPAGEDSHFITRSRVCSIPTEKTDGQP